VTGCCGRQAVVGDKQWWATGCGGGRRWRRRAVAAAGGGGGGRCRAVVAAVAVRTGAGDNSSGGEGGQGCGSLGEGEPAVFGLLVNRRRPPADVKVARRTKFGGIANQIRAFLPASSRDSKEIYIRQCRNLRRQTKTPRYISTLCIVVRRNDFRACTIS
jgi:hypothetical protein